MRNIIQYVNEEKAYEKKKLSGRIWAYGQFGMYKDAIQECKKLVRLDPDDPSSYVELGYNCDENGEMKKAIRYYRYAIKRFPDYACLYANLGYCYEIYKKRIDMAMVCYEKALELDPYNAWALNNVASTLQKEGKREDALRYYKKAWYTAKRKGELCHKIWHNLGWAYYRCKYYRRAWVIFNYLAREYPDNELVWCDFALVNYRMGDYGRAWELFGKALLLSPENRHYKRLYKVVSKKVS